MGFNRAKTYDDTNGLKGVFHFVPGRGHESMPEFDAKGFPFLLECVWVIHPREFRGYDFTYGNVPEEADQNVEQYWLRALKHDRRGAASHVKVEGNRIGIDAKGVQEARIFLNDAIVISTRMWS